MTWRATAGRPYTEEPKEEDPAEDLAEDPAEDLAEDPAMVAAAKAGG